VSIDLLTASDDEIDHLVLRSANVLDELKRPMDYIHVVFFMILVEARSFDGQLDEEINADTDPRAIRIRESMERAEAAGKIRVDWTEAPYPFDLLRTK